MASKLKTYSISADITAGACNDERLDFQINNSGYVTNYDGIAVQGDSLIVMGDALANETALNTLVLNHDPTGTYYEYRILEDVDETINCSVTSINYKTNLKDDVAYTPIFTVGVSGPNVGLIEKTEYYKDYVGATNMGTHILTVFESYTIDNSDPTLNFSARPALSRIKTWQWVLEDGSLDTVNSKTKEKLYNDRKKRHIESGRRRANIVEQLIDNVALGGILSGAFADADDAYDKLTALQELHASAFSGWKSSGRGSLITVIQNDATTTWLDTVIPDNGTTQTMIPWMIGLDFRAYIQDKLKGNIQ